MAKITLLDCTLRDGGYHNNWDFSDKFVEQYLAVMSGCGVDIVELGYRDANPDNRRGRFANCSDEFLAGLPLPAGLTYAVMLDAKQVVSSTQALDEFMCRCIKPASESVVDLMRVAINYKEVSKVSPLIRRLAAQGYRVALNLMQVTNGVLAELSHSLLELEELELVESVYFADSFGCMTPLDIPKVVASIRKGWQGEIGFHGHDNKGLALLNALEATNTGITWIDSTVNGMGRGAGNVTTESLLNALYYERYKAHHGHMNQLIACHIEPLMEKYKWGTNLFYYIAAEKKIHPMYIQVLIANKHLDRMALLAVLDELAQHDASRFRADVLDMCLEASVAEPA
ncbi:hypothetical protein [Pseudoalteromonas rubra]|uniref:Pyruvate carboxyltransferase domain-containing protein n=1 Tax=Pseudoalteromonas rubra TaxID=43658 RepID=A0A0U3HVW2_9GAMM|nr:hypothetical protein [Pseudoalteromonas rubra]ALU41734.1 hypothetical protein AT705_01610 [Pseudoalteromonas rubra]